MDTPARMKYEQSPVTSPADSYVSTSGCPYPPLSDNVMNSTEMLTPRSFDDESHFGSSISGTPAPDVKPVKKRKSWGQQLPEPKTNLPPRKRAKTEDEKEQRRVERVLRNRRAAQSSRERKRLEVEALEAEKRAIERKNSDLEMRLADIEAKYRLLEQEFERIGGTRSSFGSYSLPTPHSTALRQSSPITFSPVVNLQDPATVNPVCLSPEIRPVYNPSAEFSFDMTQHPAVSVGRNSAMEEYDNAGLDSNYADLGNELPYDEFRSIFETQSETDFQCFEEEARSIVETFHPEFDNLDGRHGGMFDEFVLCDYFNEESSANDIQCSDQLAHRSSSLQPQFGASPFGCDDGGIAAGV